MLKRPLLQACPRLLPCVLALGLCLPWATIAHAQAELTPTMRGSKAAPITRGVPPRVITDPASLISARNPEAKPVPVADLYFLRSSRFATWTPDGKNVVISTDLTGRQNLWEVPVEGGFPIQLQQSEDKSYYPTVSPDGRSVIFASDKGGGEIYDLYEVPLAGGATVNLTHSADVSETAPEVSPDSKTVAFDRRVKTDSSTNIALLTLNTGAVRLLTHEKSLGIYWHVIGFSADGKRIIANRGNAGLTESSVWSIDPVTAKMTRLDKGKAGSYQAASSISPDGRLLALTTELENGDRQAAILDLTSGRQTLLKPDVWPQTAGQFSPDGRTLLATSNVDGRDTILSYDIAAHRVETLPIPPGVNSDFFSIFPKFSPDGRYLLFPHSAGNTPFDYWIYDRTTRKSRPLTRLGLASVNPATLPQTQIVHYASFDGTVISAVLWMPYNLSRNGSAPAVVIAHGGPTGQTIDGFDPTAVALASRGYVVIAPNVRGSTGYGRVFEEANRRDLGGGDLKDEAAAARFLIASGYVNAKKIGIAGGSYGGYMTIMALAKMPDFWAAGVEEYGIVNWNSMYKRSSPALREYIRLLLGDPVKDKAIYAASSPLTYLGQLRAPLLVLQGEDDIRVPRDEAAQIVDFLKREGRTVDAKYYPGEGHGFMKREDQIDALERTVDWFGRYLKGNSAVQ